MYHPYFRGKQFELIAIRESAPLLSSHGFIPIIEPVRESLTGLKRALDAVRAVDGQAILIVNPSCGDHAEGADAIKELVQKELESQTKVSVGVLATQAISLGAIVGHCQAHAGLPISVIHAGFTDARALAAELGAMANIDRHVFVEEQCGKLYRRHFQADHRVLLRDGFQRRRNREHPDVEQFSDLHATFLDEGMTGFGDFLVVGDEYSESGGPAYAVAIHLTFIDASKDSEMFVYHFVSDRKDTPTDPAGKFAEALHKLAAKVREPGSGVLETEAVKEFLELHARGHFPGLGYVKKLSMQHHIETLADYLKAP